MPAAGHNIAQVLERRRPFQFRLSTLFVLTILVAVAFSLWGIAPIFALVYLLLAVPSLLRVKKVCASRPHMPGIGETLTILVVAMAGLLLAFLFAATLGMMIGTILSVLLGALLSALQFDKRDVVGVGALVGWITFLIAQIVYLNFFWSEAPRAEERP